MLMHVFNMCGQQPVHTWYDYIWTTLFADWSRNGQNTIQASEAGIHSCCVHFQTEQPQLTHISDLWPGPQMLTSSLFVQISLFVGCCWLSDSIPQYCVCVCVLHHYWTPAVCSCMSPAMAHRDAVKFLNPREGNWGNRLVQMCHVSNPQDIIIFTVLPQKWSSKAEPRSCVTFNNSASPSVLSWMQTWVIVTFI